MRLHLFTFFFLRLHATCQSVTWLTGSKTSLHTSFFSLASRCHNVSHLFTDTHCVETHLCFLFLELFAGLTFLDDPEKGR